MVYLPLFTYIYRNKNQTNASNYTSPNGQSLFEGNCRSKRMSMLNLIEGRMLESEVLLSTTISALPELLPTHVVHQYPSGLWKIQKE